MGIRGTLFGDFQEEDNPITKLRAIEGPLRTIDGSLLICSQQHYLTL